MKERILIQVLAAVLSLSICGAIASAHGGPVITLKQASTGPGGKITMSADGMGEGTGMVKITLTGANYERQLGMVNLTNTDRFANKTFVIPKDVPPGTYQIKAEKGTVTAQQQIEVVASSGSASSGTIQTQQSTVIAQRTSTEWIVSVTLVVLTAAVALILLWRSRDELTMIS